MAISNDKAIGDTWNITYRAKSALGGRQKEQFEKFEMNHIKGFPVNTVKKIASAYNKAFHARAFTLFASSESMMYRYGHDFSPHYEFCFCFQKDDDGQWFMDSGDLLKVRKWVIQNAKQGTSHITAWYSKWKKDWDRFEKTSNRLLAQDLEKLSDKELWREFSEYYAIYCKAGSVAYVTDSFMSTGEEDWLEKMFIDYMSKTVSRAEAVQKARILISLPHRTFTLASEHGLLVIAQSLLKRHRGTLPSYELISSQAEDFRLLRDHARRYYWIKNNYYHAERLDEKYFYEEIKKLIKDVKQQGQRISGVIDDKQKELSAARAKRDRLLRGIKLDRYHTNVIKIAELFTEWKDVRKSGVAIGAYHFTVFIKEIARRKRMDWQDVMYLVPDEIRKLFLEGVSYTELIKRRKVQTFYAVNQKGYYITEGRKAAKYFKYYKTEGTERTREIKGVPASAGYAKGRVRVIRKTEDMRQFKTGEILVINQTTPEFVPIMKKASAIVTEQGGITSHAAVVSRELRKPCVIGTKVATKVFKTGIMVEVDAINGIIRKI